MDGLECNDLAGLLHVAPSPLTALVSRALAASSAARFYKSTAQELNDLEAHASCVARM